ncbi:MAG: bifunctional phosphopantothenoylcysteine decarboxylase/phosphopantothenate--cysteine ligase CoaBC [Amylibacter sp.]|jgi:phosphopantothenoylcysteine decarboxylase/phosphopantothenate--cysteine ligase|tara:strand:+ start:57948 stop:59144 length:1197 start_codon:yes stop_codon:yes gene_type:complete
MFTGRRILLIIGGGIAAYKSLDLIRVLQKRGASIVPVMTRGASEFVTPLSVAALSQNKVFQDLFDLTDEAEMGHIELSRSADLIIVAPATADLMAKMALGLASDLATTILLATNTPVLISPAMNVRMWEHASTQRNLKTLRDDGIHICGPDEGSMACGEFGLGRMSEPESIADSAESILLNGPLKGKHVLVTSGPTHEQIDPVRYISNRSSGAQGSAIANALASLGARVSFVTGPSVCEMPSGCDIIQVETAAEMLNAVQESLPFDSGIFTAAVSDWKIENPTKSKIKKKESDNLPILKLVENPDLLAIISQMQAGRPKLVIGFAAETDDLLENAILKRKRKGCDWILMNDVSPETGIMGGNENDITLISDKGIEDWPRMSKRSVAKLLVEKIVDELV